MANAKLRSINSAKDKANTAESLKCCCTRFLLLPSVEFTHFTPFKISHHRNVF